MAFKFYFTSLYLMILSAFPALTSAMSYNIGGYDITLLLNKNSQELKPSGLGHQLKGTRGSPKNCSFCKHFHRSSNADFTMDFANPFDL